MKLTFLKIFLLCFIFTGMVGCEDDIFDKELYKKVFSLVSDDNSIRNMVHPYVDDNVNRNISVYCSGTKALDEDVEIEIEIDTDSLFNRYNEREYDLDSVSFAKILKPEWYEIRSFKTTMKANQVDPYAKFPITLKADSLSPDSTYFVPIRIKSVSNGYEINPKKRNMLYRPLLENKYAEQKNVTYYGSKGAEYKYRANGTSVDPSYKMDFGATKIMYPLAGNKVRITLREKSSLDESGNPSLLYINRHSIIIEIDENDSLKISPYNPDEFNTIYRGLEILPAEEYYDNTFRQENGRDCFFLNFRYAIPEGQGMRWYKIQERLRRE